MRYVYLLSDYGEYGAENVVATLDRDSLPGLASRLFGDRLDAMLELGVLLTKGDEELASLTDHNECRVVERGHGLGEGWGGPMLHVVPLTS